MAYRKYMFDHDFSPSASRPRPVAAEAVSVPEITVEDEPPPPTFTTEDLEVVRAAAFEDGHQAGMDEAAQSDERTLAEAMARLADGFGALREAQERSADAAQRVAAQVAMAVLRKVLPTTCESNAFEEVIAMVQDCFAHVLDEPRIIIRVPPDQVDPVRDRLEGEAEQHGFEGRVVVQGDARMSIGDCRVEWTDGGAERDQARLIADIEAAVSRALAPPDQEAEG